MDEFIEQFLIESRELIAAASQDLAALENATGDKDSLDAVFRAFHTLKGGAGIVDFSAMSRALHAAEDALTAVRGGRRPVTALLIGDLLACLDQVVRWLDTTEATGALPAGADPQADVLIERFSDGATPAPPVPQQQPKTARSDQPILDEQIKLLTDTEPEGRVGRWTSAVAVAARIWRLRGDTARSAELEQKLTAALRDGRPEALQAAMTAPAPPAGAAADTSPRTFRVEAARLDELVNLAGELSIAKNALGHLLRIAQETNSPLAAPLRDQSASIEKLVSGLQRVVLGMRVIPVRHLFQRFLRLVREMSAALEKPARIVVSGEETEADKGVIEALYEPMLHILRNAMDHGVEDAGRRTAAGKPAVATIGLKAARQGDVVVIEVSDDGAGIDVAAVRRKAAERGFGSVETLAASSDAQVIDLIFEPGFSTAARVTHHSGRGVGMDAVRTALARMGGRVAIESKAGEGSTVRLTLPFSVLMTQVMTVEAGGQSFGIPIDAIVETLRVPREQIQAVGTARAIVHRDRTLTVINLAEMLGRGNVAADRGAESTLVSIAFGGYEGAFEVERLGERVDVMLKPMAGLLKGTPGVAGTTLMGDGSVLIVLDIEALLS